MMKKLVICLLLVALAACAPRQERPAAPVMSDADVVAALAGTVWVAKSIEGQPVNAMSHVSMVFTTDNQVSGSGGCNNYRGVYAVEGGEIVFGHMAATMRLCSMPLDKQEQRFFKALEQTTVVSIENGMLRLIPEEGEPSVFAPHN